MRYRNKIKLFPGVFLNLSKSGISTTFGIPGASINLNKSGTYLNLGIPGTGIYDRKKISDWDNLLNKNNTIQNPDQILPQPISKEIKSEESYRITSASFKEFKETLVEAYTEKYELSEEIKKVQRELKSAKRKKLLANLFLIGFILKSFNENTSEKFKYLEDLKKQLSECIVNIDVNFDDLYNYKYSSLIESFKDLTSSNIIWDITSEILTDKGSRTIATSMLNRQPIKCRLNNINIISSKYPAFHFENKNGGDLFIYPTFVIIISNTRDFGIVDIRELKLIFSQSNFIETGKLPTDSKVLNYTWAKTNKNGSPDMRYKGNYQIPIMKYGYFKLYSESGLNEEYMISNFEKAELFARIFNEYQLLMKTDYKN